MAYFLELSGGTEDPPEKMYSDDAWAKSISLGPFDSVKTVQKYDAHNEVLLCTSDRNRLRVTAGSGFMYYDDFYYSDWKIVLDTERNPKITTTIEGDPRKSDISELDTYFKVNSWLLVIGEPREGYDVPEKTIKLELAMTLSEFIMLRNIAQRTMTDDHKFRFEAKMNGSFRRSEVNPADFDFDDD